MSTTVIQNGEVLPEADAGLLCPFEGKSESVRPVRLTLDDVKEIWGNYQTILASSRGPNNIGHIFCQSPEEFEHWERYRAAKTSGNDRWQSEWCEDEKRRVAASGIDAVNEKWRCSRKGKKLLRQAREYNERWDKWLANNNRIRPKKLLNPCPLAPLEQLQAPYRVPSRVDYCESPWTFSSIADQFQALDTPREIAPTVAVLHCGAPACGSAIETHEPTNPNARYVCSHHGQERTDEVHVFETVFGLRSEEQNANHYRDRDAHFQQGKKGQDGQQFHRSMRGSYLYQYAATTDKDTGIIKVKDCHRHKDEAPESLKPYVGGHQYVIPERIRVEAGPNRGISALTYRFVPCTDEICADLPIAEYNDKSAVIIWGKSETPYILEWAYRDTIEKIKIGAAPQNQPIKTVYFTHPHEHPVELSDCSLCIPCEINHAETNILRGLQASDYTFKSPERPLFALGPSCDDGSIVELMPSYLENMLLAFPKDPRIAEKQGFKVQSELIDFLKETYVGGPPSREAQERLMNKILNEFVSDRLGSYDKLHIDYKDLNAQGDYVSGSREIHFNEKGRRLAAIRAIYFDNKGVTEMANLLGVDQNMLKQSIKNIGEPPVERHPAETFFKMTHDQLNEVSRGGGVVALRWTGGQRVSIMPLVTGYLTLRHDTYGNPDGWHPWMSFRVIDTIIDISRRRTQYEIFNDNLPKGANPPLDAWETDLRAATLAKKKWSRVVVFNFGEPGFLDRFLKMSDDQVLQFGLSGYTPNTAATDNITQELASFIDGLKLTFDTFSL